MHFRVGFVALFVVACGFLLMIGGAISLLLGFDIVLTERGAAMTIGGVVALSGGVLAVGIGFALKRLNQILRALEIRSGKPVRSQVPDRPVLPIATDPQKPAVASPALDGGLPEPVASEPVVAPDAIPATVAPPPMPPAIPPRLPATAAAGLAGGVAVGAGLAAGSTLFGRSGPRAEGASLRDEQANAFNGGLDAPVFDPAVEGTTPPSGSGEVEPKPLPLDLEEELSRALAETSILRDPPADLEPALQEPELQAETPSDAMDDLPLDQPLPSQASQDDDRSFEDGLSQLLGRRAKPTVIATDPAPRDDLADLMAGLDPRPVGVAAASQDPQTIGFAPEPAADEDLPLESEAAPAVDDMSELPLQDQPREPANDASPTPVDDATPMGDGRAASRSWQDIVSRELQDVETAAAPGVAPQLAEISEAVVSADNAREEGEDAGSHASEGAGVPGSQGGSATEASAPKSSVLGTYTIDGRTYSMFADGSVEAVNESGEVERFASMNELRRHLAGA